MDINRYVYHPSDGTSVDLHVEFNDDGDIVYYKIIRVWDPEGNKELDKSTYDLTWLNFDYINDVSQPA